MFGFFEKQYLVYKKNHIRNLMVLAGADGQLHDMELDFIRRTGIRMGLKERHLDKLIEEGVPTSYVLPEQYDQKLSTLHDIVAVTLADGVIDENEHILCKSMAISLQFKPEVIDMLLEVFENELPSVEEWDILKMKARAFYRGK